MKFLKLWLPVFFWAGVIFYLSSLPQVTTGVTTLDVLATKAGHLFEYFFLTLLLCRALKGTFSLRQAYLIFWLFLLCTLYAISDEVHQFFVPSRLASSEDIIVDVFGIGAFMIYRFSRL